MPPTLVKDDPTLQNCLALLRAVWQNNHAQVYKILRESPWPDVLKGIVQSYECQLKCPPIRGQCAKFGDNSIFPG